MSGVPELWTPLGIWGRSGKVGGRGLEWHTSSRYAPGPWDDMFFSENFFGWNCLVTLRYFDSIES